MTTPDTTDSQLLGLYPQQTKNYLSIYQPEMAMIAQVSGSYDRDTQTITYRGVVSGAYTEITDDEFMVMLVGSAPSQEDYGRTWVRNATSTQIRVVESDHINWTDAAYITIYKYTEIIPVFPRIIKNPADEEDVIFYKWFDLAYTDQNEVLGCIPTAGSHFAGFGTRVYYSASGTANMMGNTMTYSWSFEGANTTGSSAHTPGYIDYPSPGFYRTILTVTSSNGAVDKTIRYISLYDRPGEGPNQPYLDWTRTEFAGTQDGRGYTCRIRLRDPIPENTVLDGAIVVIFKDDWYGDQQQSVKNNGLGRSHISMVGYVEGGTIQYNYYDGSVEFTVVSPSKIMEICEGFSISVEDSANPTTWYEMLDMTVKRAIYHYLKWQSTVLLCSELEMNFTDRDVQFFDADRTSLYDAIYTFLNGTLYGTVVSDKLGKIWMFQEVAATNDATTNLPTALTITKTNWIGQPIITERQFNDVCYIEMGGIIYDNSSDASSAVMGSAPGLSPAYHGRLDKRQGLALISQTELNNLVGDLYGFRNSRYPDVQLKMRSNYANLDIAPPEKVLLTVLSQDTPRRITWTNKAFAITGISWERDEKQQIERPTITLAEIANTWSGSTIVIPIEPPMTTEPPPSNQPPSTSISPPAPTPTPVTYTNSMVAVYDNGTFIMNTAKLNFVGNIVSVVTNPTDSTMADIMFEACGCSGSFIPGGGVGIYGEVVVQSNSLNITCNGFAGDASASVNMYGASLSVASVVSDSNNFFANIGTDATIVIPYSGTWTIQLKNFSTFTPNGSASDDSIALNNSVEVNIETAIVTAAASNNPQSKVGTLVGSDYIYEVSKFFAAGQKIPIEVNVSMTATKIFANTYFVGNNPNARIIIFPT